MLDVHTAVTSLTKLSMNSISNNEEFEQVLDGLDLHFMSQYLRKFAPYGFFPEGHPIDYDSLSALDDVQDYISNFDGHKSSAILDYGDFLKFGWTLFCISIKNIEKNDLCLNYACLAYFSASLGVAHHREALLQCKFLRLQIMTWISNDILEMLKEMSENNSIDISADDALSMLFMSDIYCTDSVGCEERWCVNIRQKCKEFEPDYTHMSREEIINKGIEIHQELKLHIFSLVSNMDF